MPPTELKTCRNIEGMGCELGDCWLQTLIVNLPVLVPSELRMNWLVIAEEAKHYIPA